MNKKTRDVTLNLFHSILRSICAMLFNKYLDLFTRTYQIYYLFTQACIFFFQHRSPLSFTYVDTRHTRLHHRAHKHTNTAKANPKPQNPKPNTHRNYPFWINPEAPNSMHTPRFTPIEKPTLKWRRRKTPRW